MVADNMLRVRCRLCLNEGDFLAMEFLRDKHFLGHKVNGIRYSLSSQVARDYILPDKPSPARLSNSRVAEIFESVRDMRGKSARSGKDEQGLLQWSCLLLPDDQRNLNKVLSKWAFNQKVEAIRFALRYQAELEGFKPVGGW